MSKSDVMNKLTRKINRVGFQIKKHSPEILLVTGVVGGITSAVMACRVTPKANEIIEKAKVQVNGIKEIAADPSNENEYAEADVKQAIRITYAQTGLELVKLYGPSVLLGAASVACLFASHNIIRKRNVALAAAYATVDNGFKEYRGRVVERFGKELDRELKHNIKAKEVEETVVNEDGTETVVTKTVNVADPNYTSDYARFFDESCIGWTKDPELNLVFLKQVQAMANDKLQREGYLYLNDVYTMLGIDKTKAGQVVGWVYDSSEDPVGDNFVDFGIYNIHDERNRAFVNGYERNILLDFNVDGNIWELMK